MTDSEKTAKWENYYSSPLFWAILLSGVVHIAMYISGVNAQIAFPIRILAFVAGLIVPYALRVSGLVNFR